MPPRLPSLPTSTWIQNVGIKATPGMMFSSLRLLPTVIHSSGESTHASSALSAVPWGGGLLCDRAQAVPTPAAALLLVISTEKHLASGP